MHEEHVRKKPALAGERLAAEHARGEVAHPLTAITIDKPLEFVRIVDKRSVSEEVDSLRR